MSIDEFLKRAFVLCAEALQQLALAFGSGSVAHGTLHSTQGNAGRASIVGHAFLTFAKESHVRPAGLLGTNRGDA